jgi:WhiB family transcriptional regulator, redox-sensing transcriptional regulator
MSRAAWSLADVTRVAELRAQGVSGAQIAREFGVSSSRIAQVASMYGLPPATRRDRVEVGVGGRLAGSTRASAPPVVPQGEWVERAACAGAPLEWFFSADVAVLKVGRAVCGVCPVRAECLDWAVETGQRGLWGGLTDRERRRWAEAEAEAE